MTTVLNLSNGAVTTYETPFAWGSRVGWSANGLCALRVTADDDGAAIVARISTPALDLMSKTQLMPRMSYIDAVGTGPYTITVTTPKGAEYTYTFSYHSGGRQRAILGRGLRGATMKFTFSNPSGAAFSPLDRFGVDMDTSNIRRVA